ncbi:MAG: HNH endonuclease [Acidimicrobiales bacterium]|jgi:hypothetical protein|nr:HNH endonuclease [Acidimicrobiales bacterium]
MRSEVVRAGEVIDEVLSEMEEALGRFDLADLRELHEEHVGPVLDRVAALANRLAAVRVATVGAVDDSVAPLRDGLRTASWVAKRTRCPARAARVDLRHDRVLRRLPHLAAAFGAGRVGQDHVAAFASLHHGLLAPLLERDERFLVPTAEACSFRELTEVLARWRLAADPDGPEPPEERRGFRLGPTVNGMFDGILRTDALTGKELLELIERAERVEWDADWAQARRLHGDAATEADLPRTRAQRLHDAVVRLLRRGAGNPDGSEPRPVVNVVITEDRLRELLEEAAGVPTLTWPAVDAAHRDDLRYPDGTPLSHEDLLRLAVRGFLRAVVVDPAGRPVAVSRRQRCYRGPLRDVLLALVRTCSFPGCEVPAQRCEVDHIEPWRHVHETSGPNGWPLCDLHQKAKEAGFTPHPQPDGTTHWTRPDGTRLDE